MLHALCQSIEYREMATMSRMSRRTKRSVRKSKKSSHRLRRHRGGGSITVQLVLVQQPKVTGRPTPAKTAAAAAATATPKAVANAAAADTAEVGNVTLDTSFTMPTGYIVNGVKKETFSFMMPPGIKVTEITAIKSGLRAQPTKIHPTPQPGANSMKAEINGNTVTISNLTSSNLNITSRDTGQFIVTVTTNP